MLDQIDSRYNYIFDVLEHDVLAGDIDNRQPEDSHLETSTLLDDIYLI